MAHARADRGRARRRWLSAAGFFIAGRRQFYRSYLWSYMFIVGAHPGLAGLAHAAVRHRRRLGPGDPPLLRGATRTLPLVALMFLPIVIGINNLYRGRMPKWWPPIRCSSTKQPYLNVPFFLGRAAFYFAGWMFLSWLFNRWSRQGRSRRPRRGARQDERAWPVPA